MEQSGRCCSCRRHRHRCWHLTTMLRLRGQLLQLLLRLWLQQGRQSSAPAAAAGYLGCCFECLLTSAPAPATVPAAPAPDSRWSAHPCLTGSQAPQERSPKRTRWRWQRCVTLACRQWGSGAAGSAQRGRTGSAAPGGVPETTALARLQSHNRHNGAHASIVTLT